MNFLKKRYVYKHWVKRLAVFCFDAFGELLFFPVRFFRTPLDANRIQKILVIRLDQLGDVVMTRPAIEALAKRFPHAAMDLLVSGEIKSLFEDEPGIRRVIGFQPSGFVKKDGINFKEQWEGAKQIIRYLKNQNYDLAIDFRGDLRNILLMFFSRIPRRLGYGQTGGGFLLSQRKSYPRDKHQVAVNLELLESLGIKSEACGVPFSYSNPRKEMFSERFRDVLLPSLSPRIVIHPSAGYPSKRWPAVKFQQLIERILHENLGEIVLIGTEEDKKSGFIVESNTGKLLDLRGKTDIADLPILFDHCGYFIGNDSGPAHVAAAQGMEVLVIFSGTNDARFWHPWTNLLHLVTHSVPCSPCESRECPLQHHDCMEKISVDQVFETLQGVVRRSNPIVEKA
jgi:lipopolysaccharide heptosyltransferase II